MRLIDADKLKRVYAQSPSAPLPSFVAGSEIDNAPTVKAIPISELRRWLNKQDMPYKDYVIGVVEYAINAWEKENETNRC